MEECGQACVWTCPLTPSSDLYPGSVAGLKMLGTEGEARALFAEEISAQHFADTARARQAGEAAAGTADSRTTRCYQLVRPSAHR